MRNSDFLSSVVGREAAEEINKASEEFCESIDNFFIVLSNISKKYQIPAIKMWPLISSHIEIMLNGLDTTAAVAILITVLIQFQKKKDCPKFKIELGEREDPAIR